MSTSHVPVVVRLATPADAAAIAESSREHIEVGLGWSWTPGRVTANLKHRETNVAVVEGLGGEGIAGFGIMTYGLEKAHLSLLAVRPGARRGGVGSALLAWLEKSALEAGIGVITLEARAGNEAAIAFYAARGYRSVRRVTGYYRGLEDAVRMEKSLFVPSSAGSS